MRKKRVQNDSTTWFAAGAVIILALAVAILAAYNVRREERHMTQVLVEKGAALIRALEAGSRTGLMGFMGPEVRLEHLLAETAQQPDILYIAVTDQSGTIVAHSDPDYTGQQFTDSEMYHNLAPGDLVQWLTASNEDHEASFMVYRRFMPLSVRPGPGPGPGSGHMERRREHMRNQTPEDSETGFFCNPMMNGSGQELDFSRDDLAIFIGMDQSSLDQARAQDVRSSILLAGLILLAGVAAVAALYWMQRLRISRRQLADVSAMSTEVVSSLPVGLVVTDREDAIVFFNEPAQAIIGMEESDALGRPPEAVLPHEVLQAESCALDDAGLTGCEQEIQCRIQDRDYFLGVGASRILDDDGALVGRLFVLRDLSEVKRLEEEVRRREKLAAIGSLASGVAHEIRNPLSSIRGFAVFFRDRAREDQAGREAAEVMVNEVDRLNRVVTELLEYARPSSIAIRECSLRDVVEDSVRLAEREAQANGVRIVTQGFEDLPPVPCDPDRLVQAVLNLLLNAIQAMSEDTATGRILTIRADEEAGNARLQIVDQGPGIEPDRLESIFDPYYTTKARGVGLGLAIVRKIIEAHGGAVHVANEEGRGAVFTLCLPVQSTDSDNVEQG